MPTTTSLFRDNTVLKSNVRTTTFTDPFPTDMTSHSYFVVAVSDKGKESAHSAIARRQPSCAISTRPRPSCSAQRRSGWWIRPACSPDLAVGGRAGSTRPSTAIPRMFPASQTPSQKVLHYHSVNKVELSSDVKNGENGLPPRNSSARAGIPAAGTWNPQRRRRWARSTATSPMTTARIRLSPGRRNTNLDTYRHLQPPELRERAWRSSTSTGGDTVQLTADRYSS